VFSTRYLLWGNQNLFESRVTIHWLFNYQRRPAICTYVINKKKLPFIIEVTHVLHPGEQVADVLVGHVAVQPELVVRVSPVEVEPDAGHVLGQVEEAKSRLVLSAEAGVAAQGVLGTVPRDWGSFEVHGLILLGLREVHGPRVGDVQGHVENATRRNSAAKLDSPGGNCAA